MLHIHQIMSKTSDKRLYRVTFQNQSKIYEIYAKVVSQGSLFGFVEIEQIVFGEKSSILVDPSEDALKQEFENTKRVFIPMHSVIRIDEMNQNSVLSPRIVSMATKSESGEKIPQNTSKITPIYTPPHG